MQPQRDRQMTVEELASDTDLSVDSVHTILHKDLGLSKLQAHWVQWLLSDKHEKIKVAQTLKTRYLREGEAFFDKIVTMDESWVSFHTPELKMQSTQWLCWVKNAPTNA